MTDLTPSFHDGFQPHQNTSAHRARDLSTEIARALDALKWIPPDLPHDDWVKLGMAAKAARLSSEDFNDWSSKADNYNTRDVQAAWRSINEGGGIGAGTLFHEAKKHGWRDDGTYRPPTPEALAEQRRAAAEMAQRDEAGIARERADTANKAEAILKAATEVKADHPYLVRKQVLPVAALREIDASAAAAILGYWPKSSSEPLTGRLLVVPVQQGSGISTLELIDGHGRKAALAGRGTKTGGYWAAQWLRHRCDDGLTLLIGEGVATVLTAKQATGHRAIAALSSGNLAKVAMAMGESYPAARLVLLADLVKATGEADHHAIDAARAVGGLVAVPVFPDGRQDKETDFNDMAQRHGLDAVSAAIANAGAPAREASHPAGDSDYWPEPTPLPDGLPAVQAFDTDLLPEALRGWVADIAERMQCPPDFPAVGALVALSSLIGARAVIAPKARDDWRVVPNLWGCIVGRPGVMKSPALNEALKMLNRLQVGERESWQTAHREWELDTKVAEMAADTNQKAAKKEASKNPAKARMLLQPADATPEPIERRYLVNDATVEKLGELLEANPWGTLSYRDELHGLLTSMDRPGQEGSRGFYLTAADGNQGYTVDRIQRGTHHIPRVCLSMLGGMQPCKAESYVRQAVGGGAGDDGLLQRFSLTVWPDISREFVHIDRWPDTPAKQAAWAVFERLSQLEPVSDTDPQEWRFTPGAQSLFREWLIPFETEIRGDDLHPALVSHLAKYRKLIPALALNFALIDTPDSGNLIHERELLRALAWSDYLRTHAERLYAAAVVPEVAGAKQLLAKLKGGKLAGGDGVPLNAFTPRQVATKHWAGLNTPDAVRRAADMLADYGWLAQQIMPSGVAGGRPSERYLLHPALTRERCQ